MPSTVVQPALVLLFSGDGAGKLGGRSSHGSQHNCSHAVVDHCGIFCTTNGQCLFQWVTGIGCSNVRSRLCFASSFTDLCCISVASSTQDREKDKGGRYLYIWGASYQHHNSSRRLLCLDASSAMHDAFNASHKPWIKAPNGFGHTFRDSKACRPSLVPGSPL